MSLISTSGIAANNKKNNCVHHEFKRRAVGEHDVHIKIRYSGLCHSDVHMIEGDWGEMTYPLVVGHEIIGDVVAAGSKVTKFKVGDVAGIGCFTDSCRECEYCGQGLEQYCAAFVDTYGKVADTALHPCGYTQGGHSRDIVCDETFALTVAPNLNNARGAPLLCAGATAYSAFKHYGVKPGMRLGVNGVGGVGHVAVKIAAAMGAEVTAISRSEGKRDHAMSLGASRYIASSDKAQMEAATSSLDMIFDTVSGPHDTRALLGLLRLSGKIVMVGYSNEPLNVIPADLIDRRLSICGSLMCGIPETQEMMDFCAKHNILADVELVKLEAAAVEKAYQRMVAGDVKSRFVIDVGL